MGRKRLVNFVEGLEEISLGNGTLAGIHKRMAMVDREELIIVTLVTTIHHRQWPTLDLDMHHHFTAVVQEV